MKIIAALLLSVGLVACGGKSKKATTPDNKTGTDADKAGTGGTTYGGAKPHAPMVPAAGGGADPCAGQ